MIAHKQKNVYFLLLIFFSSTNVYTTEWIVNRQVNIDEPQRHKGFVGCTITYNPITIHPKIIEDCVMIGCTVNPQQGLPNKANTLLNAVVNFLPNTPSNKSIPNLDKKIKGVIGLWIKVNENIKPEECVLLGLETERWPSADVPNILISKEQVKYAGGTFICCLGFLIYLLK